jgi:hypothetical protein
VQKETHSSCWLLGAGLTEPTFDGHSCAQFHDLHHAQHSSALRRLLRITTSILKQVEATG